MTQRFPEAKFLKPIIKNTLRIIERDCRAALTAAHGDDSLPVFVNYNNWDELTTNFPHCFVEPAELDIKESEDGSRLDENAAVNITLLIEDAGGTQLTYDVMDYAAAVTQILLDVDETDLFQDIQAASGAWTITKHVYGQAGRNPSNSYFGRAARVTLAVNFAEVVS